MVSGEVGVAKPDPAVFAILHERVGRPLEECVFVDDRQDNVDAAAAAGMDAILFTGSAAAARRPRDPRAAVGRIPLVERIRWLS